MVNGFNKIQRRFGRKVHEHTVATTHNHQSTDSRCMDTVDAEDSIQKCRNSKIIRRHCRCTAKILWCAVIFSPDEDVTTWMASNCYGSNYCKALRSDGGIRERYIWAGEHSEIELSCTSVRNDVVMVKKIICSSHDRNLLI